MSISTHIYRFKKQNDVSEVVKPDFKEDEVLDESIGEDLKKDISETTKLHPYGCDTPADAPTEVIGHLDTGGVSLNGVTAHVSPQAPQAAPLNDSETEVDEEAVDLESAPTTFSPKVDEDAQPEDYSKPLTEDSSVKTEPTKAAPSVKKTSAKKKSKK